MQSENLFSSISEIDYFNKNLFEDYKFLDNNFENSNKGRNHLYQNIDREISTLDNRITLPYLTKFEKARILGARSLQISMGAPLLIENKSETDALEIAAQEMKNRKIPITIRRYLPNGKYEDWKIEELIFD